MRFVNVLRRNLARLRWFWSRFGGLVRAERRLLSLASLAMVGETLFLLLIPWPIKYVADGLLVPDAEVELWGIPSGWASAEPERFLAVVCGALIAIVGLGQLCAYHRRVWSATAGQHMVLKLRKRLFEHLQRLPLNFHDQSKHGDLILRMTGDVPVLRDVLSESVLELVGRIATAIGMITIMFWVDPGLASVALLVMLGLGTLSAVFTRRMTNIVRKQRAKESAVAFAASEALRAVMAIKACGQEAEVTRRFARQNRSSLRAGIKGTKLQAGLSRWVEVWFSVGTATVLGFGVLRWLSGAGLSAGDLLLFLSYMRNLNKPLRKSARMSTRIGKAYACGERLVEILEKTPEPTGSAEGHCFEGFHDALRMVQVDFAHAGRQRTLEGVDFVLRPGEHVAVVGRNGAGKSTLIHLLLRLYEPDSGQVLLDGVDLGDANLASARSLFTLVPQETVLFGETPRECLEFVAPEASEAQLQAAIERAGARFVEGMDGGLDGHLEEGAKNLSGGQRRKLALAGALLRDRPIVVLDEPTTHIDDQARRELLNSLPEMFGGRALLVISHDPELIERMNRVVFLEDGKVVAAAPHAQLMAEDESYRALFGPTLRGGTPCVP